jgi:hypothetical protein
MGFSIEIRRENNNMQYFPGTACALYMGLGVWQLTKRKKLSVPHVWGTRGMGLQPLVLFLIFSSILQVFSFSNLDLRQKKINL